jgi:hypothetical protein
VLKELKEFPKYFINEKGELFSNRYGEMKKMKNFITITGYPAVVISIKGKRRHKTIHRLVAETFLPNPNNYTDVDHKDNNRLNCNVNNLIWCTRQYNIKKAYDLGRLHQSWKPQEFSAYVDGKLYKTENGLLKLCKELSENFNAPYYSLVKFKQWKNIIIS